MRNRDIKALKKESKQNADLKVQLKELQIAQIKVINDAKALQKEKVAFKQKEEKYNFYNKLPLKQSRDQRMNKRLNDIHNGPQANTITRLREKFDRTALNDAFNEKTIYDANLLNMSNIIKRGITEAFLRNDNNKYYIYANIHINYVMITNKNGEEETFNLYTNIHAERITSINQIDEYSNMAFDKFMNDLEVAKTSSNCHFQSIEHLKIQTTRKNKTRAGSYLPLPDKVNSKKACINIKNESDDKCIIWCMLAFKYYDSVNNGSTIYPYKKHFAEIKEPENQIYPIDILKDIPKFERLNDIKINVFEYDVNDTKYENLNVIYNNRNRNTNIMDLLLINNGVKQHLVLIKDFSILKRVNDHHNKKYWCKQCLSIAFDSVEQLEQHHIHCFNHEAVRCVLPDKYIPGEMITNAKGVLVEKKQEDNVKFRNYQNEFMHPFHIHMDFESLLQKLDIEDPSANTIKTHKHIENSVGLIYNCIHEQFSEPVILFNDPDRDSLMEKLILETERLAKKSYNLTQQHKKHDLKPDRTIKKCMDCQIVFNDKVKSVIHHDHITGDYISTLCNECNLKKQYKKFIPIYLHNLKGYDSHFIVPALNKFGYKQESSKNISCIPSNEEKYISFSKMIKVADFTIKDKVIDIMFEIRFIDSFGFMNTSLDSLAKNINKDCKNISDRRKAFRNLSKQYPNDLHFELMTKKGIYPYDYIDSYDKFSDTELPSIQQFYNTLTDSHCSEKDYKQAKLVWKAFDCKTFLDYHNLYLTVDVLLLADIWETFRATCYKIYGLDADYYYTAPGLSWDAFMKHTNEDWKKRFKKDFEIGLITDMDIYLFVESGIRGGLSQISKRHAKANNKYIPETYNKNIIDEYIIYLDANNLYGSGMVSYLPMGNFKWNNDIWCNEKVLELKDDAATGYLFEVDIHYPEHLHDLHNGYALAAENIKIPNSFLNAWQQENRKDGTIGKLCTSFMDKKNYAINYRLLKLYIKLGLEIKIHRVLQFDQSNFMESYIMKNTNERKTAKNDFEKDFFKLMNNSVYGKTMENVRNRINFKLVSSEKEALSCRNQKQRFTIFNENLVGVHLLKTEVKLNKPIFIGQTVLDESKFIMQDFHYNFMQKKFDPKNVEVLFTDTDSLCYHIKNEDPYKVIAENKYMFDLASYPKDHELYDPTNNKVIGKFKDESISNGVHYIKEFVGLRSKLYAYTQTEDEEEHKRCKGVNKAVIRNDIRFENYKNTLFTGNDFKVKMNTFRSYGHQIYTEQITKTALSRNDDKSYILDDQIHTRTFGHYKNIPLKEDE
jgi:hypothetical protein